MLLDQKISKAEKLRKNGKFDEANEIYKAILSKYPKNTRAQLGKSFCTKKAPQEEVEFIISLFDKKLYEEAKKEIEVLIRKFNCDENLYNIYGAVLSRLQKYDKAKQQYQKALELNSSFPEALSNLAELMNKTKEFNEARELCLKAIKLNKSYAEAYNNLGNSLLNLGLYKDAETSYKKSLTLNNPNKYSVFNNLGLVNSFLYNFKVSNKYLIQATELLPKEIEAVSTLAQNLIYQDKFECNNISKYLITNIESYSSEGRVLIFTYLSILSFIEGKIEQSLRNNKFLKEFFYEFLESGRFVEPKDKIFVRAYNDFLYNLNKMAIQENLTDNLSNKNIIYHLGESHCLSFAHRNILINNKKFRIKPLITIGIKAWHLTGLKNYKQKSFFISQLEKVPNNSKIFISIGEIDTRVNEGILTFHKKSNKDLNTIIRDTVYGYVSFIENFLKCKKVERFYFSIHAPFQNKVKKDYDTELALKSIKVINIFNNYLEEFTKEFNANFVDTYGFTTGNNGASNEKYMIDPTHLSPKALPLIEKIINKL